MDQYDVRHQSNLFIQEMNKTKCKEPDKQLTITEGRKYFKILSYNYGVWGFINRSNGDVLKAANWSTPAKHACGNIFEADIVSKVDWTGPRYLR